MSLRDDIVRYIPEPKLRELFIAERLMDCEIGLLEDECKRFVLATVHGLPPSAVDHLHKWFYDKAECSLLIAMLEAKTKKDLVVALMKLTEYID